MRTLVVTALVVVVGCTQASVKSDAAPVRSADSIRLYSPVEPELERPPAKYEVVGVVDVSGDFDTSGDAIPEGILRLARQRAADLNADGVLVDEITAEAIMSKRQGEPAVRSHVPQPVSLKGKAIRVATSN